VNERGCIYKQVSNWVWVEKLGFNRLKSGKTVMLPACLRCMVGAHKSNFAAQGA